MSDTSEQKRYIIYFYTYEPKVSEIFTLPRDLKEYTKRIAEITKSKAKYVVYEVTGVVVDFS